MIWKIESIFVVINFGQDFYSLLFNICCETKEPYAANGWKFDLKLLEQSCFALFLARASVQ